MIRVGSKEGNADELYCNSPGQSREAEESGRSKGRPRMASSPSLWFWKISSFGSFASLYFLTSAAGGLIGWRFINRVGTSR